MIILEGADGAGKSTLARELSQLLGDWPVHPFGPPQRPVIEEYLHWMIAQPRNELICDRFHVGEDVYGPAFRSAGLDPHLRGIIELTAMTRGAILVHVTGPVDAIEDALTKRGDDSVRPEMISWLVRDFETQCRSSDLPLFTYDRWNGSTPQQVATALRGSAGYTLVNTYRQCFPTMPGIGNVRRPAVAYVGERPNPRTVAQTRGIPFAHGPAGRHLIDALRRLGLLQLSYLTNAVKADGNTTMVGQELRYVGPQRVVALGKLASSVLRKNKVPHALAIHPMHARRFHYRTMDYAEHLEMVMQ